VSDVAHESHVATRLVAEEFFTASGPPQSAQEGLGTGDTAAGAPGPSVAEPVAGPLEAPDGDSSRTMVNVPPQPAQLPWSTRAFRSAKTASAPHSGHRSVMFVPDVLAWPPL